MKPEFHIFSFYMNKIYGMFFFFHYETLFFFFFSSSSLPDTCIETIWNRGQRQTRRSGCPCLCAAAHHKIWMCCIQWHLNVQWCLLLLQWQCFAQSLLCSYDLPPLFPPPPSWLWHWIAAIWWTGPLHLKSGRCPVSCHTIMCETKNQLLHHPDYRHVDNRCTVFNSWRNIFW